MQNSKIKSRKIGKNQTALQPLKKATKKKKKENPRGQKEIEFDLEKLLWKNRVESDRISAIHLYIILGECFSKD